MEQLFDLLLPWPWRSVNWITDTFVYSIFLFFTIFLGIFLWKTIRRCSFINGLTREIIKLSGVVNRNGRTAKPHILNELRKVFESNGELAKTLWQEFENSLLPGYDIENSDTLVYKTSEASFFFNEDRLLGQYINLRFWNSVPAMLVGLGILGTFVGLVWGLIPFSKINFEQTGQIRNAIQVLLSGVSTAFVTSVWGMIASLLFNGLEKWRIGKVSRAIADLQHALDPLFTLITLAEITRSQQKEFEQLAAAFKSSATDIASAIAEQLTPSLDKIDANVSSISEETRQGKEDILQELRNAPDAFSQAVAKQLGLSLDKLNETVKKLREEKDESSTEAIRELVEEFKNALSGSFTKEIETLVTELSTVSQSLIDLPTRMENMMEGVRNKINEICEHLKRATVDQTKLTEETIKEILNGLRSAITELNNVIDSTTSKASTESSEMIRQIQESVKTTADRLNKIFVEGETRVSTLLEKQGELIDAVNSPISKSQEALDKGNDLLDRMNTSLNNANEMIVTMQAFSDQLKGAASTLKTAGDDLTKASTDFNKQNKEYLDKNRETNQNIQESLRQSQELLNEFAEKFNTIESRLQDIFVEIDKGLTAYSTTTRESIEDYLKEFSEHLKGAAEKLAGSVTALDSSVEELSDMLSRLRGIR